MRTLKRHTPCDEPINGEYHCPYMDESGYVNCEYWCAAGSDEDWDPASADEVIYEAYEMDVGYCS